VTPSVVDGVNLILFKSADEAALIASDDPRAKHIRGVLRASVGSQVYVGVVNGVRGLGTIQRIDGEGIQLEIAWEPEPPIQHPIRLLVGLPRPHTAKRVLFDAACLGVESIDFFQADKGEPSYAKSSLWSNDDWQQRLWLGAEQGFATQLPKVHHHEELAMALKSVTTPSKLALDLYEAEGALSALSPNSAESVTLAIGVERGWSASERDLLRTAGFRLASLGERVLRTEAAGLAGVSVILGAWGRM